MPLSYTRAAGSGELFDEAAKALPHNKLEEEPKKEVLSGWVIDCPRPTVDGDAVRLGSLISEIDYPDANDDT